MLRKHYAGIIIIRRSDGKVLYQLRDDKSSIPTPNKWATFGGGILREGKEMKFMKREEYLRLKNSYWPTRQFIKYYLTNRKINKLLTNC